MIRKARGARGEAGGQALKKSAEHKVRENKKRLLKALKKFKEEQVPLIKTELAIECGLSIATLNRQPYKDIIREHIEEEKVLLSPKGKQEVAALINENRILKQEIETWKEKYLRLKKEMVYLEELFN